MNITDRDRTDLADTRDIVRNGLNTGFLDTASAVMVLAIRLHSMAGVPCPDLVAVGGPRVAVAR